MSADDQTTWLAVAAETLRGMPSDLLEMGCKVARETVDHPSKIVVAIMKAVKPYWERRKAEAAKLDTLAMIARGERRRLPWEAEAFDPATRCAPDAAAAIASELGVNLAADAPRTEAVRGPRRAPTDADYAAMGISAEQLAASRAAAEAEAAAPTSAEPASVADIVGPLVAEGGACPHCGTLGVSEHRGRLFCDGIGGCGADWRVEAKAA